jgi:poly(A) polymerase/tRNA nucleotidyltransferase (CCA-adding enzyme)
MMMREPVRIPDDLKAVAKIFAGASKQCWLVGGAVRDGLMGRKSEDFDLATDAGPDEVMRIFKRTIPTGVRHGTVTILFGSHKFETTTFRRDGDYTDGRRPDRVAYSDDIRDDLARRDFTMNAIAWDLIKGRLLDPHGGRDDIRKRLIRAIGAPAERFNEDGLRVIRACRFAAQLGFRVDDETRTAIGTALARVPAVSAERIWEELKKILGSPKPSEAFRLFRETGILDVLLPELALCVGAAQKGRHVLDVFDHSITACDLAPPANFPVRAAALFHDIAKPVVKFTSADGEAAFHRHDTVGAEITEGILLRLRASNSDRERISRLVKHHMFHYTVDWTDAAVRRFIARVGVDLIDDLLELRKADASAIAPDLPGATAHLAEFAARIDGVLEARNALTVGDLALDGRDLMEALKLEGGPVLGNLLRYLLDCVLEDPEVNRKEKLLDMASRWLEIYG